MFCVGTALGTELLITASASCLVSKVLCIFVLHPDIQPFPTLMWCFSSETAHPSVAVLKAEYSCFKGTLSGSLIVAHQAYLAGLSGGQRSVLRLTGPGVLEFLFTGKFKLPLENCRNYIVPS